MAFSRRVFLKAAGSLAILPVVKFSEIEEKVPVIMYNGDIIHGAIYPSRLLGNHEGESQIPHSVVWMRKSDLMPQELPMKVKVFADTSVYKQHG